MQEFGAHCDTPTMAATKPDFSGTRPVFPDDFVVAVLSSACGGGVPAGMPPFSSRVLSPPNASA